ncbi:MAG: glycosyltransferase [Clostridia bacterium]|nr:glycosyltransferase [Clostridia bacterium]
MKILQINATCGVGSTGRIAADIHQMLLRQNHQSLVAYARKTTKKCPDQLHFAGHFNFITHVLYTFITDRHGFASRAATRRLLQVIEQYKPDLIHLQAIHGYYINIELLFNYLAEKKLPVVWTLHDCWSFTGHCAYYDYSGCQKWRVQCEHCPSLRDYPISLLLDNSRRNYRDKKKLFTSLTDLTLVTPSHWLAGELAHSFQSQTRCVVIHNGINLETFQPVASDFRNRHQLTGKFMILGVASVWDRRKGLNFFLELAQRLPEECRIVLVGLSHKQLNQLPASITGLRKTDSVRQLAELYSTADVFVNPTLEDNYPTTNLEALSCGTPVITFQTGGSVESVDAQTGYIARQGDLADLLEKILLIKAQGKNHFAKACRDKAENEFNREDKYQQYIDLYQSLLTRGQS